MRFSFSPRRFLAVLRKEFHHIMRDPTTLMLIFIMPIFMIILFGFAVSGEIRNVPTVVLDLNRVQAHHEHFDRDITFSDALVHAFDNSQYFNVLYRVETREEMDQIIREGRAQVAVIIPANYSARFNEAQVMDMDRVRVYIDGADPAIARIAAEASTTIVYRFSVQSLDALTQIVGNMTIHPTTAERGAVFSTVLNNPALRQRQFLVPAIIAVIVFSIIIVLTSSTIVREKERGTIEQLMITPMTKTEFMLGKLSPYLVVGFFDILLILGLAYFLFGISAVGSIGLFITLGMLFVFCALGLGILISTFSSNQGQAIMLAIVFIIPSLILCGIIAPVSTMPGMVQFLANLLPLTHFMEITRGIIISGLGASYLSTHIWALSIFAVAVIVVSILKFKKSLD
ncbi:MAG: ABC transporter permease [Firmicutes bacterium]|nr:ABC transporter permease [Bacillota bacterium]